jgi:hypothetical protein
MIVIARIAWNTLLMKWIYYYFAPKSVRNFRRTTKSLTAIFILQTAIKVPSNLCIIKLHAPTSSTQKLKLMGEMWAIHLYSNTPPHVEAPSGLRRGNRSELQLF